MHLDPYGRGWIARLAPSAWDGEITALVHGEMVAAAMAHHAWLNQLEP